MAFLWAAASVLYMHFATFFLVFLMRSEQFQVYSTVHKLFTKRHTYPGPIQTLREFAPSASPSPSSFIVCSILVADSHPLHHRALHISRLLRIQRISNTVKRCPAEREHAEFKLRCQSRPRYVARPHDQKQFLQAWEIQQW